MIRDRETGGAAGRGRGTGDARPSRPPAARSRPETEPTLRFDTPTRPAPRRGAGRPGGDPDADPYTLPDEPEAPPVGAGFGRGAQRNVAAPTDDDPTSASAWYDDVDDWPDEAFGTDIDDVPPARPARPVRRPRSVGARPARARTRPRTAPQLPPLRVPAFLATADLAADRVALGLTGANLLSVLLMAIVLGTAAGRLPDALALHLDAAGLPDRWGSPRVLWRLPLLAAMTTLLNLGIAWFLAPIDRFAGRFLLAAALVVQLIAWVALFDFV